MENSFVDRRHKPRPQRQEQPQQNPLNPQDGSMERVRALHDAERKTHESIVNDQARKQSGHL